MKEPFLYRKTGSRLPDEESDACMYCSVRRATNTATGVASLIVFPCRSSALLAPPQKLVRLNKPHLLLVSAKRQAPDFCKSF